MMIDELIVTSIWFCVLMILLFLSSSESIIDINKNVMMGKVKWSEGEKGKAKVERKVKVKWK